MTKEVRLELSSDPAFADGLKVAEGLGGFPLDNPFITIARIAGANRFADGIECGQMESLLADEKDGTSDASETIGDINE